MREKLKVGDRIKIKISALRAYGYEIDLGEEKMGTLRLSQVKSSRTFKEGEEVQAEVIGNSQNIYYDFSEI